MIGPLRLLVIQRDIQKSKEPPRTVNSLIEKTKMPMRVCEKSERSVFPHVKAIANASMVEMALM